MNDPIQSVPAEVVAGATVAPAPKEYVSKRGRRALTAALILLLILLLVSGFFLYQFVSPKGVASKEELKGVTWVRSIYGFGEDLSQMVSPAAVEVDPSGDGTLWIGDQGHFRIVKFDENAQFLDVITGDKASGKNFDFPSRFAVAPDGWLYVAQSTYNNVLVFNEDGELQNTIPFPNPAAIDVNDEMLVVGAPEGFVAFDREGNPIGQIGGVRGTEEDRFDMVNGLVLDDDNNVYAVDSFNNRISKYDAEGERVWMVETGVPGNRAQDNRGGDREALAEKYPAMLQTPMGATIDGAGRLVVIDMMDFSISAFDAETGEFIAKWGDYGVEDGKFSYPSDIEYDPAYDWFVVADAGNARAQVIRLPDSGGDALAGVRRFLSGPIKACLIPLLLVILLLTVWILLKRRDKKRREAAVVSAATVPTE